MKADTVQLVHIFGTDRRHVVPIFQRPYVWNEELNWAPLWADVKSAAEEVEAEQAGGTIAVDRVGRTHFLGAIVLERLPVAPGRIVAMNVIDGQQRLVTLQVLLLGLRVLLGGLETALRKDKSELLFVPAQVAKLNIEHLIPQKWSQYYPLPTDRPIEEAEERRGIALHKLGNLTLTTTKLNSSISNGSWPTKRKELNKHAVLLVTAGSVLQAPPRVPSDVAIAWLDTWDEDRIELRTVYLAKIATHAWPGPGA